ncbi:hypothetical protein HPB47_013282 [Ixodes persulcatus]|uniref:Uncharacterized protein n=1 Tax=Ixodes persulcatus TaxID=34615 RepID=A0AC60QYV9_IXOPE|nr:hypothetical protein HPB47_013282 [Ixodes persulcatus]
MRRGSAGADATGLLTASSDHREAAGAECSTRAASAVVDEDGFQQVPPRRRVKIAVGSDKTKIPLKRLTARRSGCRADDLLRFVPAYEISPELSL